MSEVWSYIQEGATRGPVPREGLQDLLNTGRLRWDDMVWRHGMADWAQAGTLPELRPMPPPEPPRPAVAAETLDALRATKPWVRFMGVLGLLGTVFLALVALAFLGMSRGPFRNLPEGLRMAIPAFYLVIAAFQLPPVLFLNRYASRIKDLLKDPSPEALTAALGAQKSFWKYVGVMTLVVLCLYVLAAVVGIGAAFVMGGLRRF